MRIHRDERGQTIILVALSLPILLGFIGMATDVGLLFMDKRQIQTAADSAAVAGALNLHYGSTSYTAAAKAASAANGYTDGSNNVTVTVHDPPTWPSSHYVGTTGYVEATVSKQESTFFLALFGHSSVTVTARAVATNGAPGPSCIYTLGQSGTGMSINGFTVSASKCGIDIDSSSGTAFTANGATLNVAAIGIVGGYSLNGVPNPPPITTGIIPYSDPLSFLPQASCRSGSCSLGSSTFPCMANTVINTSNPTTLSQGCYNGLTVNGNGNVTLNSGTYIINSGLIFNGTGTISGSNVTIYINSGSLTINGTQTLSLSAPTSGALNGILFDQNSSDNSAATFNGNANSTIDGILYFPDALLNVNGNGSTQVYTDLVAKSINFNGNMNFHDYAALPGVTSPISSVALVE